MARRSRSTTGSPISSHEQEVAGKAGPSAEEAQELTAALDTLSHLLHEEKLTAAVEALTYQVRQLMLVMDDIREDLVHAVRNDMLNPCRSRDQWRPVVSQTSREDDGAEINGGEAAMHPAERATSTEPIASTTTPARSQRPLF